MDRKKIDVHLNGRRTAGEAEKGGISAPGVAGRGDEWENRFLRVYDEPIGQIKKLFMKITLIDSAWSH